MKLIIHTGPEKDKEIELHSPFVSIGRETDNDIIVSDAKASRYHAKVEEDGKVWVIRDLNSSNGVQLNGRRINESAPLTDQDVIKIGEFSIRYVDHAASADSIAAATPAGQQDAAAKKTGDAGQDAQKKRVRLLVVALVALLVIIGALLLIPSEKAASSDDPAIDPIEEMMGQPLQVQYERLTAGREIESHPYDAFLYQINIANRELTVRVRSVRDKLTQEQSATLTESEENELKKRLLGDDQFLQEESRSRRKEGFIDRHRILVMAGRRGNALEYLNESDNLPDSVQQVINLLDDLARDKTQVIRLPRSQAFAQAEQHFLRGNALYAQREVFPENLFNSIKSLEIAIELLKGYDDPPGFYEDALRRLREAQSMFEERIDELQKAARFQERTSLREARQTYQLILDRIPDDSHPAYRDARKRIILINEREKEGR